MTGRAANRPGGGLERLAFLEHSHQRLEGGGEIGVVTRQVTQIQPRAIGSAVAEPVVRLLGAIDLAGGLGVLLPAVTRMRPRLTVLAVLGCVALQIYMAIFHASRGEVQALSVNTVFLALAGFILWGRWRPPIAARQARSAAPSHRRNGVTSSMEE